MQSAAVHYANALKPSSGLFVLELFYPLPGPFFVKPWVVRQVSTRGMGRVDRIAAAIYILAAAALFGTSVRSGVMSTTAVLGVAEGMRPGEWE